LHELVEDKTITIKGVSHKDAINTQKLPLYIKTVNNRINREVFLKTENKIGLKDFIKGFIFNIFYFHLNRFNANALQGKPLPVYGDGLNVRDWIYVYMLKITVEVLI